MTIIDIKYTNDNKENNQMQTGSMHNAISRADIKLYFFLSSNFIISKL